jgi:hypothetical protein
VARNSTLSIVRRRLCPRRMVCESIVEPTDATSFDRRMFPVLQLDRRLTNPSRARRSLQASPATTTFPSWRVRSKAQVGIIDSGEWKPEVRRIRRSREQAAEIGFGSWRSPARKNGTPCTSFLRMGVAHEPWMRSHPEEWRARRRCSSRRGLLEAQQQRRLFQRGTQALATVDPGLTHYPIVRREHEGFPWWAAEVHARRRPRSPCHDPWVSRLDPGVQHPDSPVVSAAGAAFQEASCCE